jgi:hypothetical protein
MMPHSLRRLALLVITTSLAVACSGPERDEATMATAQADYSERGVAGGSANPTANVAAAPAPAPAPAPPTDMAAQVRQAAPSLPGGTTPAADEPAAGAPMLIRTANASIEVTNVDSAVVRLRALAARVGGYVTSSTVQAGDYEVRSATLEIKVPAPRFDDALGGLQPLGKVEFVNIAAQDVGEEFTDVTARVANARRLEERLVELLATRTGKLEDVLAVERELARVREEIERYQGRLRYLGTRVAMSTLSATVHEKGPLAGTAPGQNPLIEALRAAWRNFVGFVAGFIALLGVLVPLGVLVWLGWLVARRLLPRRAPRRPDAAPPKESPVG